MSEKKEGDINDCFFGLEHAVVEAVDKCMNGENNFCKSHDGIAKAVDKYMVEVEIPAMRARRMIPLCYIGILFGAFLMFLACAV